MINSTYTGPATGRVVWLTNVHYDTTEEDICQFFQGYTVTDQIRAINPRVGTNCSVYAMFSTIQERNAVVANFRNCYIRGRRVKVMPALSGNYAVNFRPPRGVTWDRRNQTANGDRGGNLVFQDNRNNPQASQAGVNRDRADAGNTTVDRVSREYRRGSDSENRGRGRGRGGRSHGNGAGVFDGLLGNERLS